MGFISSECFEDFSLEMTTMDSEAGEEAGEILTTLHFVQERAKVVIISLLFLFVRVLVFYLEVTLAGVEACICRLVWACYALLSTSRDRP